MENNKEENNNEITLEILEKFPDNVIKETLDSYGKSSNLEAYAKLMLFIVPVLFLIHNIFIAGNSYEYSTYNRIKNIELTIVGVFVLSGLIMGFMIMSNHSGIKKKLKNSSIQYQVKLFTVEEEFNALATHLHGGSGIQLKKF